MLTAARPYSNFIHSKSKYSLNPVFLNQTGSFNKQRYKRSDSSSEGEQLLRSAELHRALRKKHLSEEERIKSIKELLEKGANINFQDSGKDKNTPLQIAVQKGYLKVVNFLLQNGADFTLENNNRETPKDLAAGKPEILAVLEKFSPQSSHLVSPNQEEQSVSVSLSHQPSVNQEEPLSSQQVGWNCFDVAIDLAGRLRITASEPEDHAKKAREELVRRALIGSSNEDYHKLLAPEIRHAAALTVAAMNDGNQADGYLLPNGMRTDALKDLYNRYSRAFEQEETKAAFASCNDELGNREGQRKSWDELQSFFQDNGNRVAHPRAYAKFNEAKSLTESDEKAFSDYCLQENTYRQYIQEYYGNNEWFAFQADGSTSMVDVTAKLLGIKIIIYNQQGIVHQTEANGAEVQVDYNWQMKHFTVRQESPSLSSNQNPQSVASNELPTSRAGKRGITDDGNNEGPLTKKSKPITGIERPGPSLESPMVPNKHPNIFENEKKDYSSLIGLKNSMHGNIYQLKLLMLFLKRGIDKGYNFLLGTEVDDADKFDDLVFRYQDNQQKEVVRFLQAKHKQDEKKTISYSDLINETEGEFSLVKYFISYRKISKKLRLKGELKDFILCTNINFNTEILNINGITTEPVTAPDELLEMNVDEKTSVRCKLKINEKNQLYDKLKETSEAHQLAKYLVEYIGNKKTIELRADIIKSYHTALAKEVIDTGIKKFKKEFIDNDKKLSEPARKFRKIFLAATEKSKEPSLSGADEEEVKKKIGKITLELSKNFGSGEDKNLPADEVTDEDINGFFEKLIFAVDQPNEIQLGNLIKTELGEASQFNLLNAKLVVDSFQREMQDWFKEKKGRWFSRDDGKELFRGIEEKINTLISTGMSFSHPKELKKYGIIFNQNKLDELDNFLSNHNKILHIITQSYTRLSAIKVAQVLENSAHYPAQDSYLFTRLNTLLCPGIQERFTSAFTSPGSHNLLVIDCELTTESILELYNKLSEIIKKKPNKKIILIAAENDALATQFKAQSYTHQDKNHFSDLTADSQAALLAKQVNFQGDLIALNQLISLDFHLTASLPLEDLIEGKKIEIGKPIPISYGYDPDFYIDRTFNQQIVIKQEIKNQKKFSDLLAYNEDTFNNLCRENPNANIHWLQQKKDGLLIWQRSQGRLEALRRYIDTYATQAYPPEKLNDFLQQARQHQVMLIADTPGMGKTTVLTHLSQQIKAANPAQWVVRLDLNDYTAELQAQPLFANSDQAIVFLATKLLKLNIPIEQALFKESIQKTGKVSLLFDGFDEISPDYKEKVLSLLKTLKTTPVEDLWVTTRPRTKNDLENQLQQFSYTLEPFSEANQISFLTRFWRQQLTLTEGDDKTNKLEIYAKELIQCLSKTISDKEKELTGIPLQIRLLAETYQTDAELFVNSDNSIPELPEKLSLMELYEKFIENKYTIFYTEKVKSTGSNVIEKARIENEKKDYIKHHQQFALEKILSKEQVNILQIQPTKPDDAEALARIGIVQITGDKAHFIHPTFAEYFAAVFFSEQIKIEETSEDMKDFIIKEIFIKPNHQVVRIFIDDILEKYDSPSEYIMKLYGDRIDHLWRIDKEKLILSGEGVWDGTILAQGVREGNVEIVKFLLGGLKKGGHKKTLKELLLHMDTYGSILHRAGWETGTPDALDEIFKGIKYLKEENGSVMVTGDDISTLLKAKDYRDRNVFHRVARWGREKVLEGILKIYGDTEEENKKIKEILLELDNEGQSAWARVGRGGSVDVLNKLLHLYKENTLLPDDVRKELLIKKGITVFNQAVKWGNIEILNKLLSLPDKGYIKTEDLKEALYSTDNKGKNKGKTGGRTIWHRAVYDNKDKIQETQRRNREEETSERKCRRIDVLNKLMEFCKKAELTNKEIKELLEKGNQKGNTALHLAVKKGLFDETQWLAENMVKYEATLDTQNSEEKGKKTALVCAAEEKKWDLVVLLMNHGTDINDLDVEQCGLLRNHLEQGNDENKAQLLEKIEQRLSALPVASVREVAEQAGQVLEPMEVDEAGPSRCRRDLRGCGGEEQGQVFPYEPLEESVSVAQQRAARLQSQLALALVWEQREPADKLLQYQRYLGDILEEGAVNQSPREQGLLRDHYQQAQQFFADNPKTTLLEVRADNFEPLAGHSVLLENGQQSLLVFNAGERYQLYSPDFNYRQRFQSRLGVSWSTLSQFFKAFFQWKSGSGEYHPAVLTARLPGKALAQLQAAPFWHPDALAPDSVLLAREQAGLIEGIPARVVRELLRVNGQVVDSAALHADFFQTPGIQLRVEKLHSVLSELSDEQRRHLVRLVNNHGWSADSTLLETLSTEERPLLVDYQHRVMTEFKNAPTLTPERLSEFSWQALNQAFDKYPDISPALKQQALTSLQALHTTATRRAWAKGMATQTLFFLPEMIRAANTGQVGGLVGTAGLLAADGGVNHLYGRLLERLAPTLSEARLGLLQKLPVTSPVFKALTVYSIVELTQQLHTLPVDSPQRQTIKHRLGEQYVTAGLMVAELFGFELGPLWIGLIAEQLIFEAITFRKENQLDIPFWEAFIMSLGFEQDKLQHIIEERQLAELNLATVDNINTRATPPYGWVLVKVPSLGPLLWQAIEESQVPPHIREEIINQPPPFSLFPSPTIIREAASFRQIEHYELNWVFMTEGDEGSLMTGHSASPILGKLLNTTWHLGTYAGQATAIHMQWGPSGHSCQEDNVFLATSKAPLANYHRIASVTGKNYPLCLPNTPVKISGSGLAALYVNNRTTATVGAPSNLYLGFDPREGDITLLIQPSGLRALDNINRGYHPDAAPNDTASYHLTVQVSNKGYPPAIVFQPQLGILMVEEKSRRLHSHYFISSDSAPFYLYDDALTTRIAMSPPSTRPIGFIVRSYGPKGLIQLQTWSPNSTQPIPAFPPRWYTDRHAVNFKQALQPLLPHQVSTLYLPNKKYLQLMLDQQQIAGVLMLEAEQVEVLAAKGQDAYQSGIYMTTAVASFTVTIVGHLQVMQGNTRLFFIGETPDNTPVIRYSKQPTAPHSPVYQLELTALQPVLDSLCRLDAREIHFSTPGLSYAWVPDVEQPAVLKIMGSLNGQLAQLLLEQDGSTLSQLDEQQQLRIMAVDHYSPHATLDNQLVLQQVIPGGNTTNLGVYQAAVDPAQDLQVVDSVYPQGPGDILWFQSPQGYPVLHRFASGHNMTLNGIDYQIADNRLSAVGAQTGIIDGDQLIRYRTPTRRVGIRVAVSLAESQLSWDKGELTLNQLTLRNLPEQTPIDLGGQAFPLKALKESVHRHRHHHRRDLPRVEPLTSGAARHQPWASTLFKEAATLLSGISWKWPTWGSTATLTDQPTQPLQNSKITVDEYTSGHFQGGLQLLDLVIRKWIGKKYLPPALTQNIDEQQRTAAAERAYAAYCPQLPKLRQSLATALHEPHATPPQPPWLAYPLPTTEPHPLTHQLT